LLWTQERLAADAGLSARTVSDIERGIHPSARLSTLARLADALRLTDVEREQLLRFGSPSATVPRSTTVGSDASTTVADLAATIGAWGVSVVEQQQVVQELSDARNGSSRELCDALLGLGRSATLALRRHDARPAFVRAARLALAMGDRERLVAAAAGYTFMTKVGDPVFDADETWRRALMTLADDDLVGRTIVIAARATAHRLAEEQTGPELAAYALDLARKADDADALAVAISAYVMATWGTPNVDERRRLADELSGLAATLVPFVELAGVELSAYPRLECGDVEGFESCADRLRSAGAELRHPYAVAQAEAWSATIALLHDDFEEAEHRSVAAVSMSGHAPNFTNGHLAQVFSIRLAQGRADELLPQLSELVRDQPGELAWRAAWAAVASREPQHESAVRDALRRVQHEFWPLARTWTYPVTAAFLLDAACNVGNSELISLLARDLGAYAGSLLIVSTATACEGSVEHFLGRAAASVGDADRGIALLERAREQHTRLNSRHLVARSDEAIHAALAMR
jgi:hypothetical protein